MWYARVPRRGSFGGLLERSSFGRTTGQWLKRPLRCTVYQSLTAIGHSKMIPDSKSIRKVIDVCN
ncbi:MAG: hypothetical protein V3U58_00040 [Thermodesulfobacteriota bacterium]